jgi:hypothetical protein
MGAEDVRDLQFGTMHWSPSLAGPVLSLHKQIKWAGDVLDRFGGHLGIDSRGFQLGVPKQYLNHPYVCPAFQQMRGKAVSQRMRRYGLLDLGKIASHPEGAVELPRRDRIDAITTWKHPASWARFTIVIAQQDQ